MKKLSMTSIRALFAIIFLSANIAAQSYNPAKDTLRFSQEKHLRNIRILSFLG